MPTGVVKFFNANKGYGFIKPDDGGSDVFVHASERAGLSTLAEGMRLGFDPTRERAGRRRDTYGSFKPKRRGVNAR